MNDDSRGRVVQSRRWPRGGTGVLCIGLQQAGWRSTAFEFGRASASGGRGARLSSNRRSMRLAFAVVDVSCGCHGVLCRVGPESLTVRGMGGLGAFLKKQWGVVILVLGILAWAADVIGPQVLILVAVVSVFYFLLAAPLRCIALGRQGRCRNNAQGLLRGCWIREHKWQGLKALRGAEGESQGPSTALMQDRQQMSASLGVAVGVLSAIVACADFIFK